MAQGTTGTIENPVINSPFVEPERHSAARRSWKSPNPWDASNLITDKFLAPKVDAAA